MTDYTVCLSRTERHVLDQIYDGNHTIEDLITATGFPQPRLLKYLTWLHHDEFIEFSQPDSAGTSLHVELTDKGIERSKQPKSWQALIYD